MSDKRYHQYEVRPIDVVSPKGVSSGWHIVHLPTEEWVTAPTDDEPNFPWVALTYKCAIAYVRYLNCLDDVEPPCYCHNGHD
jgi:hypothetical protein